MIAGSLFASRCPGLLLRGSPQLGNRPIDGCLFMNRPQVRPFPARCIASLFLLLALASGAGTAAGTKSTGSESVDPEDFIFASSFEAPPPSPFDLSSATPPDGSVLAAEAIPTISIRFSNDGLPSPQVRMLVDGADVTAAADIVGRTIRYVPSQAMIEGAHSISVRVGTAAANWSFRTASAPQISELNPSDEALLPSGVASRIGARLSDVGSGVDPATVRLELDGRDVTAEATVGADSVSLQPTQPHADGEHRVRLLVQDRSGNSVSASWRFTVTDPPQILDLAPVDTILPYASTPTITATFRDARQNLDFSSVRLVLDHEDVVEGVEVVSQSSREGRLSFTPAVPLAPGTHHLRVDVRNLLGEIATAVGEFSIAHRQQLSITDPSAGTVLLVPETEVRLRVASSRGYADEVSVNGVVATVQMVKEEEVTYAAPLLLAPGDNDINARAVFADGEILQATGRLNYDGPPTVTIASPSDWQTLGALAGGSGPVPGGSRDLAGSVERPVAITGQVSKPVVSVSINQQQAQLDADRRRFTFERFLLHEGTNLISATATDASGRSGTAQITVYLDQTAPLLSVEGPVADGVTSAATVDVRGVVNDAVEGGVNAPEPQVVVRNAANQQSVTALVTDRYYLGRELPLEIGANTITVTASDAQGNARSRELRVTRIAAGSSRVTLLGGDRQTGAVLAPLPQPLVVAAIDDQGLPLAGHSIHFDVLRGAGSISRSAGQQDRPDGVNAARNLLVETGADGRAEVWLTPGSEASQSGNMIRAWSTELAEDVMFTATGLRQVPAVVMVSGAAGSQYVQTQSQPVEPLTAVVLDAQRNAMTGTPVIFTIEDGDAVFSAASAANGVVSADGKVITVPADKNGLASVRPTTGNTPGNVRVRAHVQLDADTPISNAVFNLLVLERTNGPTGFSGVVLDHSGKPLQGVRLTISRTPLSTLSGSDGRFVFDDQVPPGKIDLDVDGRPLIVRQGASTLEYPRLHFETAVVQGRMNQLPHPIYLPPINHAQARVVGGDEDVRITVPGLEGFEMIVRAHSVTFPDGSREGPIVLTPVHVDRLPMVPPGPSSVFSAVAWTIQPTSARFDPPITVKIPNVEKLKPGETTPIVQWDHDLAAFIPMGRGTVSEDGTQIVTDPGSGITKAGWGGAPAIPPPETCGTNPPPPVCRGRDCSPCPDCYVQQGQCRVCMPSLAQEGPKCDNDWCKRCRFGVCKERYATAATKPEMTQVTEIPHKVLPWPAGCDTSRSVGCAMAFPRHFSGGASIKLEAEPYCDGTGVWRFRLTKLEHQLAISARPTGSGFALLTDTVINSLNSCNDLNDLKRSFISIATRDDPNDPGAIFGFTYGRPEATLGHEVVHVRRYIKGANNDRQGLAALAREMDNFTVSMETYPAPDDAIRSPELRLKFDELRTKYLRDVITPISNRENQNPHPNAAEYNNQSLASVASWIAKIDARRRANHCN